MATHSRKFDVLVYGSYGYTGALIVKRLKDTGLKVLLSGRDAGKLQAQSAASGFPAEPFVLKSGAELNQLLSQATVLLNCAGPFSQTAAIMVSACMAAGTHYLDITGEYRVFEDLMKLDDAAQERGIVIMPGVGFDVVPTDCLALHLKQRMPAACKLEMAFVSRPAGVSRGTARTAMQSAGEAPLVRKNGKLESTGLPAPERVVDFGPFKSHALCISWGDIATAYRTTGIPDIEVYLGMSERQAARMKKLLRWGGLVKLSAVRMLMDLFLNWGKAGPSDQALLEGKTYVYGRVTDPQGNQIEARLEAPNGYRLTADAAVEICGFVVRSGPSGGYHTPAAMMGADFVSRLVGVSGFL